MRDIKFRAWDGKRMRQVFKIIFLPDGISAVHFTDTQENEPGALGYSDERLRMMQYTGRKDKNGKEVFEGDRVYSDQWSPKEHQVVFHDGSFWLRGLGPISKPNLVQIDYIEHFEVVGNIHENPTLMS